jgi:polar amino acid transport system permease protein
MNAWLTSVTALIPDFWAGSLVTLKLTAYGLGIGFLLGLPAAIMRVYGNKWVAGVSTVYTELFRGTPALVQLFIIYYGLPDLGLTFDRLPAAIIALGLNSGAYQAEYFRGAIQAIGSGQLTAARSIGMSTFQAVRYIILPQALRLVIPAWSNEPISLLKTSAIVFLIAVADVMGIAKQMAARTYDPLAAYFAAAFAYLIMAFAINAILSYAEKKAEIPGFSLEVLRT